MEHEASYILCISGMFGGYNRGCKCALLFLSLNWSSNFCCIEAQSARAWDSVVSLHGTQRQAHSAIEASTSEENTVVSSLMTHQATIPHLCHQLASSKNDFHPRLSSRI